MSAKGMKVNSTSTLFFARLGAVKQHELKQYCEQFGHVKDVTIITDSKTMKSKGCGFVKFLSHASASRCLDVSQQHHSENTKKSWVVEWAKSTQIKEIDLDKYTIYITGLTPRTCTEESIRLRFNCYGTIEKITVPMANGQLPYAFIRYVTDDAAAKAIHSENGKEWDNSILIVEYSEAMESKRIRRQKASIKKLGFASLFPSLPITPVCSPLIPMSMESEEESENESEESSEESSESNSTENEAFTPTEGYGEDDILDILLSHSNSPMGFSISKPTSPFWDPIDEIGEPEDSSDLPVFRELRDSQDSIPVEVPSFVHSLLY
ncbi:RNA recognition motif domain containing protein [Entamoeba marina]